MNNKIGGGEKVRKATYLRTYFSVVVYVEPSENTSGQPRCVPFLKNFLVHLYELIFGQIAARAVFEETFVPRLEFFFFEFRMPEKISRHLWVHLTLFFSHL